MACSWNGGSLQQSIILLFRLKRKTSSGKGSNRALVSKAIFRGFVCFLAVNSVFWAEIHQSLLSQFYLLVEFFIAKLPVKKIR